MVDGNAGKGSKYRPVDRKKYEENWEKVFGQKPKRKSPGVIQPGGIIDMSDIQNKKEKENE
tara:strand:+ start:144 stop:326 length:183 start_codon:yes stop_codon:yes gene_type:complete